MREKVVKKSQGEEVIVVGEQAVAGGEVVEQRATLFLPTEQNTVVPIKAVINCSLCPCPPSHTFLMGFQ